MHVSCLPPVEVAFETESGDSKSKFVELDYGRCMPASGRIILPHPGLEERYCTAVPPLRRNLKPAGPLRINTQPQESFSGQ